MKDAFTCPICSNILIDPLICKNCTGTFCKDCIFKPNHRNNKDQDQIVELNQEQMLECAKCCAQATFHPSNRTRKFLDKL